MSEWKQEVIVYVDMRNYISFLFSGLLAMGFVLYAGVASAAGPIGTPGPVGTPGPIHSTPELDPSALAGLVAGCYWGYPALKELARKCRVSKLNNLN